MTTTENRPVDPWWTPDRTAAVDAALDDIVARLNKLKTRLNEVESDVPGASEMQRGEPMRRITAQGLRDVENELANVFQDLSEIRTDPGAALGI